MVRRSIKLFVVVNVVEKEWSNVVFVTDPKNVLAAMVKVLKIVLHVMVVDVARNGMGARKLRARYVKDKDLVSPAKVGAKSLVNGVTGLEAIRPLTFYLLKQ